MTRAGGVHIFAAVLLLAVVAVGSVTGGNTGKMHATAGGSAGAAVSGRRLVVNLDVNKTILGGDKVQGLLPKENLISSLVSDESVIDHVMALCFADETGGEVALEFRPSEAEAEALGALRAKEAAAAAVGEGEAAKEAARDLHLERQRVAKRRLSVFVKKHPADAKRLFGEDYPTARRVAEGEDAEDEYFVSFIPLLKYLIQDKAIASQYPRRVVVFRTFGSDGPDVMKYLRTKLEGEFTVDIGEQFLKVMHDKKPTREERADYPYLAVAGTSQEYSPGQPHTFEQFRSDMEDAIVHHPDLRSNVLKILCVEDDFGTWKKLDPRGGKTIVIDSTDFNEVQLFLDDNVDGAENGKEFPYIVNVRDAASGYAMPAEGIIRRYVANVVPTEAVSDPNYMINKVNELLGNVAAAEQNTPATPAPTGPAAAVADGAADPEPLDL